MSSQPTQGEPRYPSPRWHLEHGDNNPFDDRDDGTFEASTDWAHRAARGVLHNLLDRRAIKWGFQDIDEAVRAEIVSSMAAIIRAAPPTNEQNETGV